jgi:hypothetical protein
MVPFWHRHGTTASHFGTAVVSGWCPGTRKGRGPQVPAFSGVLVLLVIVIGVEKTVVPGTVDAVISLVTVALPGSSPSAVTV